MKKFLCLIVAVVLLSLFAVTGCDIFNSDGNGGNVPGMPDDSAEELPDKFTAEEDIIVNFATGETSDFYSSHNYSNGQMFNCTWSRDNTVIKDGIMNMSVTKGTDKFYGAEYRSSTRYSYGYYSVCMKAAKCSGVVSSFFTYTNNPWDEIDIEFLGNDTTKVQLNYYTSSKGGPAYHYSLGFDASEDFHEYGFDWQEDSLTWYVDGKAVYRATAEIPVTDTQIMMNVWNCIGHDEWTGPLDESSLPATAQYKWVAYKAA